MIDNLYLIKQNLDNYLKHTPFNNIKAQTTPKGDTFPKIVIQDITNTERERDFGGINRFSAVTYEIEIYAKASGGKSERTIANELKTHIRRFMEDELGLKRVYDSPTPNIDTSVYRITMRYTVVINDKRNKFIY